MKEKNAKKLSEAFVYLGAMTAVFAGATLEQRDYDAAHGVSGANKGFDETTLVRAGVTGIIAMAAGAGLREGLRIGRRSAEEDAKKKAGPGVP